MANIRKIEGKAGTAYKITVTRGRDNSGRQMRHYITWTPPRGMSEKRAEKEVQKVAVQFENQIEQGFQLDNRQTFEEYARYVIDLKERGGAKHNTIRFYRDILWRAAPAIGSMKLTEIRPQHLNRLYKELQAPRTGERKATGKGNLAGKLKEIHMSRAALARVAGVAPVTVTHACRGEVISGEKADAIAAALAVNVKDYFHVSREEQTLSGKTVLEYHRFIHAVLRQAEKEMLVPYNAAAKATPPAASQKDPEYFQPGEISTILDALEDEPEKWHVLTHLLIVTGCRRGEIAGLKWSKVDLEHGRLEISANLCYLKERGVYETTTKTGNVRFVNIPSETVALLRKYRASQAALRLANGDRGRIPGICSPRTTGGPSAPPASRHG